MSIFKKSQDQHIICTNHQNYEIAKFTEIQESSWMCSQCNQLFINKKAMVYICQNCENKLCEQCSEKIEEVQNKIQQSQQAYNQTDQYSANIEEYKEQLLQKEKEIIQLKVQLTTQEDANFKLEHKINDLDYYKNQKEKELSQLQKDIIIQEKAYKKLNEDVKIELKELKLKYEQKLLEIQLKENELVSTKQKHQVAIDQLKKQMEKAESAFKSMIQDLEIQLTGKTKQVSQLNQDVADLKADSLRKQEEKKQEIDNLNHQIEKLKQNLKDQNFANQKLQEEITSLNSRIKEQMEVESNLRQVINQQSKVIEQMQSEAEKNHKTIESLQKLADNNLQQAQQQQVEKFKVQDQLKAANQMIEQLRDDKKAMEEKINKYIDDEIKQQEQLKESMTNNRQLYKELDTLKNQLKKTEKELKQNKKKLTELEEVQRQFVDLQQRHQEALDNQSKLQQQINSLKNQLQYQEKQYKKQIEDLNATSKQQIASLQEALQENQQVLTSEQQNAAQLGIQLEQLKLLPEQLQQARAEVEQLKIQLNSSQENNQQVVQKSNQLNFLLNAANKELDMLKDQLNLEKDQSTRMRTHIQNLSKELFEHSEQSEQMQSEQIQSQLDGLLGVITKIKEQKRNNNSQIISPSSTALKNQEQQRELEMRITSLKKHIADLEQSEKSLRNQLQFINNQHKQDKNQWIKQYTSLQESKEQETKSLKKQLEDAFAQQQQLQSQLQGKEQKLKKLKKPHDQQQLILPEIKLPENNQLTPSKQSFGQQSQCSLENIAVQSETNIAEENKQKNLTKKRPINSDKKINQKKDNDPGKGQTGNSNVEKNFDNSIAGEMEYQAQQDEESFDLQNFLEQVHHILQETQSKHQEHEQKIQDTLKCLKEAQIQLNNKNQENNSLIEQLQAKINQFEQETMNQEQVMQEMNQLLNNRNADLEYLQISVDEKSEELLVKTQELEEIRAKTKDWEANQGQLQVYQELSKQMKEQLNYLDEEDKKLRVQLQYENQLQKNISDIVQQMGLSLKVKNEQDSNLIQSLDIHFKQVTKAKDVALGVEQYKQIQQLQNTKAFLDENHNKAIAILKEQLTGKESQIEELQKEIQKIQLSEQRKQEQVISLQEKNYIQSLNLSEEERKKCQDQIMNLLQAIHKERFDVIKSSLIGNDQAIKQVSELLSKSLKQKGFEDQSLIIQQQKELQGTLESNQLQLKKEFDALSKKFNDREKIIDRKTQEIVQLMHQLKESKKLDLQIKSLNESLEELKKQCEKSQKLIEQLKNQLNAQQSLSIKMEHLQDEIREAKKQDRMLDAQMKSRFEELTKRVEQSEVKAKDYRSQIQVLEMDCDRRLLEKEETNKELRKQLLLMEQTMAQQNHQAEIIKAQQQSDHQIQVKECQDNVKKKQIELDNMNNQLKIQKGMTIESNNFVKLQQKELQSNLVQMQQFIEKIKQQLLEDEQNELNYQQLNNQKHEESQRLLDQLLNLNKSQNDSFKQMETQFDQIIEQQSLFERDRGDQISQFKNLLQQRQIIIQKLENAQSQYEEKHNQDVLIINQLEAQVQQQEVIIERQRKDLQLALENSITEKQNIEKSQNQIMELLKNIEDLQKQPPSSTSFYGNNEDDNSQLFKKIQTLLKFDEGEFLQSVQQSIQYKNENIYQLKLQDQVTIIENLRSQLQSLNKQIEDLDRENKSLKGQNIISQEKIKAIEALRQQEIDVLNCQLQQLLQQNDTKQCFNDESKENKNNKIEITIENLNQILADVADAIRQQQTTEQFDIQLNRIGSFKSVSSTKEKNNINDHENLYLIEHKETQKLLGKLQNDLCLIQQCQSENVVKYYQQQSKLLSAMQLKENQFYDWQAKTIPEIEQLRDQVTALQSAAIEDRTIIKELQLKLAKAQEDQEFYKQLSKEMQDKCQRQAKEYQEITQNIKDKMVKEIKESENSLIQIQNEYAESIRDLERQLNEKKIEIKVLTQKIQESKEAENKSKIESDKFFYKLNDLQKIQQDKYLVSDLQNLIDQRENQINELKEQNLYLQKSQVIQNEEQQQLKEAIRIQQPLQQHVVNLEFQIGMLQKQIQQSQQTQDQKEQMEKVEEQQKKLFQTESKGIPRNYQLECQIHDNQPCNLLCLVDSCYQPICETCKAEHILRHNLPNLENQSQIVEIEKERKNQLLLLDGILNNNLKNQIAQFEQEGHKFMQCKREMQEALNNFFTALFDQLFDENKQGKLFIGNIYKQLQQNNNQCVPAMIEFLTIVKPTCFPEKMDGSIKSQPLPFFYLDLDTNYKHKILNFNQLQFQNFKENLSLILNCQDQKLTISQLERSSSDQKLFNNNQYNINVSQTQSRFYGGSEDYFRKSDQFSHMNKAGQDNLMYKSMYDNSRRLPLNIDIDKDYQQKGNRYSQTSTAADFKKINYHGLRNNFFQQKI